MATRLVYEVREAAPGYFTYDVEVHADGHARTRQASGAFRSEQLAEQAAALAVSAIQVHLTGIGFAPLPIERRGVTPRGRRCARVRCALGYLLARAVIAVLVGGILGGVLTIIDRAW